MLSLASREDALRLPASQFAHSLTEVIQLFVDLSTAHLILSYPVVVKHYLTDYPGQPGRSCCNWPSWVLLSLDQAHKPKVEEVWHDKQQSRRRVSPNSSGCYNLDCAAFVQVDNLWVLGGSLTPYSTDGGAQYVIEVQWKLYDGNWWLFVKGSGDYVAVGYYPGPVFNGGQMSKNAQYITYGGETASLNDSDKAGQMGSGKFANTGYSHAAYQRTIFYIDTASVSQWATLGEIEPTPSCYRLI